MSKQKPQTTLERVHRYQNGIGDVSMKTVKRPFIKLSVYREDLTVSEQAVYSYIAGHKPDGAKAPMCWASYSTIAESVNIGETQVKAIIKKLESVGCIYVIREKDINNKSCQNIYVPLIDVVDPKGLVDKILLIHAREMEERATLSSVSEVFDDSDADVCVIDRESLSDED